MYTSRFVYLEGPVFEEMRKEQEGMMHTINFYAVLIKAVETYVREWMDEP